MESNEKVLVTKNSEKNIKVKKQGSPISLLGVRVMVCLIIFGAVIFVKINNPCVFENFRFWYQNNMCEEKFKTEEMREKAASLFFTAKEKLWSAVSKYHSNNANR